jgi:hypothetical protein
MTGPRTIPGRLPVTEKDLERFVRDAAAQFGWRRYHTHRSDFSPAGWPDEALVRGDTLILAELKTEKARLSPAQTEWIDDLGQVDIVKVRVWRPSNIDDIITALR